MICTKKWNDGEVCDCVNKAIVLPLTDLTNYSFFFAKTHIIVPFLYSQVNFPCLVIHSEKNLNKTAGLQTFSRASVSVLIKMALGTDII